MDQLTTYLFSYPAIILVAAVCVAVFVVMLIRKTLKAIVILILFAVLTAMVVVKVGVIDKKQASEVREKLHDAVKEKIDKSRD